MCSENSVFICYNFTSKNKRKASINVITQGSDPDSEYSKQIFYFDFTLNYMVVEMQCSGIIYLRELNFLQLPSDLTIGFPKLSESNEINGVGMD